MIKVLIVDDHPIVRAGMRSVLKTAEDIAVVAEGTRGDETLPLIHQYHPDVLVLDVNLPGANGVEVTRQLRAEGITIPILILTVQGDGTTIFALLESGATGYILKDEALETLAHAVRAVAAGKSWLSPAVAQQVVHRAVGGTEFPPALRPAPNPLTPRETEVLILLAQGLDNAAIAGKLVVTMRTIQNHVSNIYGKLGVASRTEAALYAIRHKLVDLSTLEEPDQG
ncbi:MAG: response regulator transcription factor [Anaerolineae bacterium]|nr:response regulator transcription factor [Anaerolineae bacterium]